MEVDELVVAGIVMDDDIRNPIRLIRHGAEITGVLADEIEVVDQDTFEMVIYLEGSRRDNSGDMAAAEAAARINM